MTKLAGKFVWFEHVSSDTAKAKGFYGEAIGWKVTPFPMGDKTYDMLTAGETPIGGYKHEPRQPAHWTSYLAVDDVDATLKKVTAAGGKIIEPAFNIPTVGRMAKVADPEGATFWVMRGEQDDEADKPPAHGLFHWNELWARDAKAVLSFYEKTFGYAIKSMDMPDGVYHVLEKDGIPRAGIMTSSRKDVPPMWLPYIAVDDCDATTARAKKLGGQVHHPPTDIPNVGRFAVLGDTSGAAIGVIKPIVR